MANFLSQKWLLPRRHFLRGLGVSLGLPMLDCMRHLRATEAAEQPRRSIFVYLPNGVNTHDYELTQAGPDYEFSRILAPLAKHKGNISPISGLHHPNAFGIAHSATQTWLTAAKHGPTDRNTISVDQLIASVTGPQTRFSSLQISNQGQPLAVSADGIALPAHRQSGDAFKALFTEPKGGIEKQRRRLQRRESMLDLVLEDANVLANKLDLEDRGRLDQYLTAVREVEVRTKRGRSVARDASPRNRLRHCFETQPQCLSGATRRAFANDVRHHRPRFANRHYACSHLQYWQRGNRSQDSGDRDQPRSSLALSS